MSTPGKTHPSVISPPPIKKIINNKRTLYIPALQAPRQLFNEVEGGRDSNHGLCLYTQTQARFGCGDIYTVSHPVFPPAGASINFIQSSLSLSGPSYWKNSTGGRWRSTHLYTCIYVSAAGRSMYIPNTPFVLSYSILNHGIEIKWNKRGKSNILLHNISSRELFLAQSHIWRAHRRDIYSFWNEEYCSCSWFLYFFCWVCWRRVVNQTEIG